MSRAAASRLHRCIARWTSNTTQVAAQQQRHNHSAADDIKWVFLGPPGVGKGTYASRVANTLGVAHIAAGDLVRAEIKSGSELGQQVSVVVPAAEPSCFHTSNCRRPCQRRCSLHAVSSDVVASLEVT